MNFIKKIFVLITLIVLLPLTVNAASGTISVSGSNKAVVGNKVTVTVTLSSNTLIGSWQMDLNYDRNMLQLTGSSAEGGGTRMVNSSNTGVRKKSYTFTFKALKTGNAKVAVDSYLAYSFNDLSALSLSSGSKSIKIITQAELEASYSKNNNLKSLGVENFELTEKFSKDTLEYNVVVPEDTKEINIVAQAEDSKSNITGTGTKEVTLGNNTFQVVVRAENGSEKTYTINVLVKDANPINVKVGNANYTVVKIKENLPPVTNYNDYTLKIDDIEIPAYKNDNTNIVLVGLKDESGNVNLFMYDEDKKEYKEYKEIGVNKITIIPLSTKEEIKGYKKDSITINNQKCDVYVYNEKSNFVIIYGMNVETGEKGYYMYDKKTQVISKYNDEYVNDLNKKLETYSYIIIGFSSLLIIMFIVLIFLVTKKNKKKQKKNIKPEVINHNNDKNKRND